MKIKHILLAAAVLVSVATFAQKDELKKLRKIYEKDEIKAQDLSEYIAIVNNLMPIATEEGDKIYANFYKAMIPVLQSNTIDKTMPTAQMQAAYLKLVNPKAILFLQPEWSKKEEMTPLIVDYVMKNPKWRVSLQTHKYLNIP